MAVDYTRGLLTPGPVAGFTTGRVKAVALSDKPFSRGAWGLG